MTKLKIRITEFDPVVKRGRFFIDKEQTVFLHEFNEGDFFEILEAIGKIVNSGRDVKIEWIGDNPLFKPDDKSNVPKKLD